MGIIYQSVPINSVSLLPVERRSAYFERLSLLPPSIRKLLFNPQTGAYIRGLGKVYNFPVDQAPLVSLSVLETFLGFKELAQLGAHFSSKLQMPNDRSQQLARDVEKELFSPVMLDFNAFLATQKQPMKQPPVGTQNVINLKNQPMIPRSVPPKPMNPTPPPRLG